MLLPLVLRVVPVRPVAWTVVSAIRILTMSGWCRLVGTVGPLEDEPTFAGFFVPPALKKAVILIFEPIRSGRWVNEVLHK